MKPPATCRCAAVLDRSWTAGRYAPSPTGSQHLGNAFTALVSWAVARAAGARFVLRMDDLDTQRCKPEFDRLILDELAWLGIDWDEGPDAGGPHAPYRQSQRGPHYQAALKRLARDGHTADCWLSRKDLTALAGAPHGHPQPYGTDERKASDAVASERQARGMAPAVRFRLPNERRTVSDRLQGVRTVDLIDELGDPVLYRRDGMFGYQLATVVDDHLMGIDHVVRARDLWADAALQATIGAALDATEPAWLHLPLVVDEEGRRLSKRWGAWTLAELRPRGASAARLRGWVAHQLGITSAAGELSPDGFMTAVSQARALPQNDVVVHADAVDALRPAP